MSGDLLVWVISGLSNNIIIINCMNKKKNVEKSFDDGENILSLFDTKKAIFPNHTTKRKSLKDGSSVMKIKRLRTNYTSKK